MALIRLNNQSISSVTALPSGVGGKVLQVVSANGRNSDFITTSTSLVEVPDSGITITPTSTSSRVMVTWQLSTHIQGSTGSPSHAIHAYRGTTDLGNIHATRSYTGSGTHYYDKTTHCSIIDHPNSTSALTYKLYAKTMNGGNWHAHRTWISDANGEPRMRIVAMEIESSTEWSS